jgi:hypothetical protein
MQVGTKSVLFGAHAVFLHPIAVFAAHWQLYGFPWDPHLLLAFAVHDLGYLGRESVEGLGSEEHVELGGRIMDFVCGRRWGDYTRRHSRSWCWRHGEPYSRLCVADKLAFVLTPAWLYLPMTKASGELEEYMSAADGREGGGKFTETERRLLQSGDPKLWLTGLKSYTQRWVELHRNERREGCDVEQGVVKKLTAREAAHRMRNAGVGSENHSGPRPILPVQ